MLELEGSLLIRQGDVGSDCPWREFGRVGDIACIVLRKAGAELAGDADVEMVGV